MERSELMLGEGAKRLRAGPLPHHRPDGESRQVPDDRMLRMGTALMRFAPYATINSFFPMRLNSRGSQGTLLGFPRRTDLR
jgi:hypothetical protein